MSEDNNAKDRVENDAKGQFAKSQGDSKASGVASAKPTALTPGHSEDATVHRLPPGDEKPGGIKWNPPV
jgi:hypothetical protein